MSAGLAATGGPARPPGPLPSPLRGEAGPYGERLGCRAVRAQVSEAGEGLGRGGLVTVGDPPQRGGRGLDPLEPLVATAYERAVRAAVDVRVQVLVGPPDRQIDDNQRVAGSVGLVEVALPWAVPPDEAGRLVGEIGRASCRERVFITV